MFVLINLGTKNKQSVQYIITAHLCVALPPQATSESRSAATQLAPSYTDRFVSLDYDVDAHQTARLFEATVSMADVFQGMLPLIWMSLGIARWDDTTLEL